MTQWETCWKSWWYDNKHPDGTPFSEMEGIDKLTNEMGNEGWEAWNRDGKIVYFKRETQEPTKFEALMETGKKALEIYKEKEDNPEFEKEFEWAMENLWRAIFDRKLKTYAEDQ